MSNNKKLDAKLKAALNNTAWQRGLSWRNEKLHAIAEARRRGIPDREIWRELKRAGLIDATAQAIMHDATYLEDSETTSGAKEECALCGKDITEQVNSEQFFQKHGLKFCNKTCSDQYSKREGK